jgi:hypothetical protein
MTAPEHPTDDCGADGRGTEVPAGAEGVGQLRFAAVDAGAPLAAALVVASVVGLVAGGVAGLVVAAWRMRVYVAEAWHARQVRRGAVGRVRSW